MSSAMQEMQIRERLDKIQVFYENDHRRIRCFCDKIVNGSIVPHMRDEHSKEWEFWQIALARMKSAGLSYYSIIKEFKTKDGQLLFTSSVVEREIQKLVEKKRIKLNIPQKNKITDWQPGDLHLRRDTLWTFKDRGNWAVHQGDYRGNWSPYVPRALIELYSQKGDIVVDPFVGGGTTLIETWLTGRYGYGVDISPLAVRITKSRIQEMLDKASNDSRVSLDERLRPIVIEGDSRNLKAHMKKCGVMDNSVKLICAHPPYLNSLRYTATIDKDLSRISDPIEFLDQIQVIAGQMFDLLADDGICAVLVGDVRKNKSIIPLGFLIMERLTREGFKLKEILIKSQHKDFSTRFWYTRKDKLDFLIAHEYLFVFSKSTSTLRA